MRGNSTDKVAFGRRVEPTFGSPSGGSPSGPKPGNDGASSSSPAAREFVYRPRWSIILLGGVFFGACALVIANEAEHNRRGLIINHLIELDAHDATIFYWILVALSVGFVAMSMLLAVWRLVSRQRIVLGESEIIVPTARFSNAERRIPYDTIRGLSIEGTKRATFLRIRSDGRDAMIVASLLPSKTAFQEVCMLLHGHVERVQRSRSR